MASASVSLTWKFNTVAAGDVMTTFAVRRRQMAPTVGAYEYWTGAAWGAETFIAPGSTINDGQSFTYAIATGWTTGSVYQWSVKTRNAAAEASSYAVDNLIQIHAVPSMTVTISSSTISRPNVQWLWAGATGFYQKSYRVAVYTAAVRNGSTFDASSAASQALATWIGSTVYNSSDWKVTPDADFLSGTQYYVYTKTEDSSDLSSGWVNSANWTPSYTTVPAPTITAVPDATLGVMNVTVRGSFNMLDDNSSVFTTGIANWIGSLNCEPVWNVAGKMLLYGGGMNYSAMDTAQTTYLAADTAYTTYAAQAAIQGTPTGTSRAVSGSAAGQRLTVVAGTVYSAVATVSSNVAGRTAKIGIRWYNDDAGTANATPVTQGTGVALTLGLGTAILVTSATAPALAVRAVVEIEWTTSAVGDILTVDNIAFAATATIAWSPSGGAIDVSYVLERSKDGGVTWSPVWGCSKASPKASDLGNVGQISVVDRAVPIGTSSIQYRAYAISKSSTTPTWSALASVSLSGMNISKWFMRNTSDATKDVQIMAGSFNESTALRGEVIEPEGRSEPIVTSSMKPKTKIVSLDLITTDKTSHELVMTNLRAGVPLYIQTNLDGSGFYVRPVGGISRDQKRSAPVESYSSVRNVFTVSFTAAVVKDFY